MRDGDLAKHPLTHPGWFTFSPDYRKTTLPRVCGCAAFFDRSATPPCRDTRRGKSRHPHSFPRPHPALQPRPARTNSFGNSVRIVLNTRQYLAAYCRRSCGFAD